ncbi:MAG: hypothetical protein WCG91_01330 [Candidatus Shapirobacteria bacterium]
MNERIKNMDVQKMVVCIRQIEQSEADGENTSFLHKELHTLINGDTKRVNLDESGKIA